MALGSSDQIPRVYSFKLSRISYADMCVKLGKLDLNVSRALSDVSFGLSKLCNLYSEIYLMASISISSSSN